MSEFWGLERIARRMNVSGNTILKWRETSGFLMYKRKVGPRVFWYSDDSLIQLWQVSVCSAQLRQDREKRAARANVGRQTLPGRGDEDGSRTPKSPAYTSAGAVVAHEAGR